MTRCSRTAFSSRAKGDAAKAIREFEYLSALYPQNPQVRYQLARAYSALRQEHEHAERRSAVERLRAGSTKPYKLDPHFDPAILLLAELKIRKGNPAAAVDLLAPLTKERPQIAQAHYLLASAYLAQQKRDEALAVYRQMTELFPKDPQPPFLVGNILLAEGQQAEARNAFEKSVEISPDYLPADRKAGGPGHCRKAVCHRIGGCRSRSIRTRSWRKRGPLEARFIWHNRISRTPRRTC